MTLRAPSFHRLNWAFFWFLAFLILLVIGLVAVGQLAGTKYQFFGPGSRWWAASKMQSRLQSCPPDHVILLWFRRPPFTDEELREYDLSGSTVTYGGISESAAWCEYWNTVITVNHDGRSRLTPGQVAKVESLIASLPASNSAEPLEESLSVAINRQGKLQIYHYQFDGEESFQSLPSPIAALCTGGSLGSDL